MAGLFSFLEAGDRGLKVGDLKAVVLSPASSLFVKRRSFTVNLLYTGLPAGEKSLASRKSTAWLTTIPVVLLTSLFIYFARPSGGTPVRAEEVKAESLVSSLTTNGKVEATDAQELRAEAPGFVRRVLAKEGDAVRGGQLLAELDNVQAASQVAHAQAELDTALADWQAVSRGGTAAELQQNAQKLREARAARDEAALVLEANERLLKRNAIARADVDESRQKLRQAEREISYLEKQNANRFSNEERERATARVNSARAALAYARQQLGSTRVVAPVPGIVYSLPIRAGNYVNTGELLARLGNLDRVRVRVFVDEPELGRLAPGQEVHVTWPALPGVQWSGTVERLPAEVKNLGTRSVGEVVCTIDNRERKLLANVNVDVQIISAERPGALTLPKEAVMHSARPQSPAADEHYVFVIEDGVVHRRPVTLGVSNATRFEIVSGVQAGQKVAVPGDRPLEDGMKVKVVG